jgi:hypothetical protein
MELHDRDAVEDREAERIASAHLEPVRVLRVLRAQRSSETLRTQAETTTTMQRPIAGSRLKT